MIALLLILLVLVSAALSLFGFALYCWMLQRYPAKHVGEDRIMTYPLV